MKHYGRKALLQKKIKQTVIKKNILSKTISIDEILKKYNFIDVIKIDIETHEYKILPSIFTNMHKIGKIYCELNGSKKYF